MPQKTGLKVLQMWGGLLIVTAVVIGITSGTGYAPAPGKSTVVTIVLAVAGVLALAVGSFVRWRFTVRRRRPR